MFVIRDLLKNEGFAGFFKGLTPKVLSVPPSLPRTTFTYSFLRSAVSSVRNSSSLSPWLNLSSPTLESESFSLYPSDWTRSLTIVHRFV